MGPVWLPAFLQAPVWRFCLPAGMCGQCSTLGLMLPSVDKAGRYFPLTFAALRSTGVSLAADEKWLDQCETAGRAALERNSTPQQTAAILASPTLLDDPAGLRDAVWWSEGSVCMEPTRMLLNGLPDVATYVTMLGSGAGQDAPPVGGETRWESTQ